jgi:hypothetical protein
MDINYNFCYNESEEKRMTLCYLLLLKNFLTCYIVGYEPEPERPEPH